jgi:hypothetical protein
MKRIAPICSKKNRLTTLRFILSGVTLTCALSVPAISQQQPIPAAAAEKTTDGRLLIKIPFTTPSPLPSASVVPSGGTVAAPPSVTCINPATDAILMTAPRVIVTKNSGLFRTDEEAGLYFNVTFGGVITRNNREEAAPPFVRDNVSIVNVRDYQTGQVTLPLEGNVIDYVKLNNGEATITKAQIKMYLLKKQGNNEFGFVVKNLAEFSKKLPLPPNPLGEGLRAVSDLTSSLLSDENNKANNIKERAATVDITLNFVPGGSCDANSAITGMYGVISKSTRRSVPGFVDIAATNMSDYCFGSQSSPVSALMVGRKPSTGGACVPNQYVDNDYVMFVITKYTIPAPARTQIAATYPSPYSQNSEYGSVLGAIGPRLGAIYGGGTPPGIVAVVADDVPSILRTYRWYPSLTRDFRDRLTRAATGRPRVRSVGSNTIHPDDVLAEDYVMGVNACLTANIDLKNCALPAPPTRLLRNR